MYNSKIEYLPARIAGPISFSTIKVGHKVHLIRKMVVPETVPFIIMKATVAESADEAKAIRPLVVSIMTFEDW